MRVLLIEDEKALSAAICKVLKSEQIVVDAAFDGEEGLDDALTGIYDAIILDVMLPKLDGFSVLRELRENGSAVPILMLTARAELEDRLRGLRGGADYYLPKPFQMEELIACLRVITRRKAETPVMALQFGDTELSESGASLINSKTGASIKLGAKEYQLMELFMRHPRQILKREQIIEHVWGFESDAEYNSIEVYISFLRKKLAFIQSSLKIRATRGIGYSLEEEVC